MAVGKHGDASGPIVSGANLRILLENAGIAL